MPGWPDRASRAIILRLASLSSAEIRLRLKRGTLRFSVGSFDISLRSSLPALARGVSLLYADYALSDGFVDYHVEVDAPGFLRRWFRPQVNFAFDGQHPFRPLPIDQAFAMFEWGLNWVVANHAHQFAIIHAAVAEQNGRGFIFPGAPGSGKSTLCAALACRGWRVLSDEMALVSLQDGRLRPVPRPISLKNASIDIIRGIAPDIVIGEVAHDTSKGSVAHMRLPTASIDAGHLPALPNAIVFPTYKSGAITEFVPMGKGLALMRLAENCFNYPILGAAAFTALADAVEISRCYSLVYSDLDQAIAALES